VTPGRHHVVIETDAGETAWHGPERCYRALSELEGYAVYVRGNLTELRHTTGADLWQAKTWRGKATTMTLDGTTVSVRSLRGALEGCTDPYGELQRAMGWMAAHGVNPGSLSSMGWNLWRSTLTREVTLDTRPTLGRSAMYGGRQAVRLHLREDGTPRPFTNMAQVDLRSAYPAAMASRPYAAELRRVDPATAIDPNVAGIVMGTVDVPPELPFGAVPYRVASDMIQFPSGRVHGYWPWCEVAACRALGLQVTVERCWAPAVELDLFGAPWLALAAEAAALEGYAAKLCKGAINGCWGMFGMRNDDVGVVRWTDAAGLSALRTSTPESPLPHAATCHIAAETAARVRAQLFDPLYAGIAPIHVDTDGYIVRASAARLFPSKAGPGEWRVKSVFPSIEVRGPQFYRYDCRRCGLDHAPWHYVCAGAPPDKAAGIFRSAGRVGSWISDNGIDIVLPGGNVFDRKGTRAAVADARAEIGSKYAA
jgi:hypothetical protein